MIYNNNQFLYKFLLHKTVKTYVVNALLILCITTSAQAAVTIPPIPSEYEYDLCHNSLLSPDYDARRCDKWHLGEYLGRYNGGCVNAMDPAPWSDPSVLVQKAIAFYGDMSGHLVRWLDYGEKWDYNGCWDGPPSYYFDVERTNVGKILTTTPTGGTRTYYVWRTRPITCPDGYSSSAAESCVLTGLNPHKNNNACTVVGNPIHVGLGNKQQQEIDYRYGLSSLLRFTRSYTSTDQWGPSSLGVHWRHNYSRSIKYFEIGGVHTAVVYRQNGDRYYFVLSGDVWESDEDISDELSAVKDANENIIGWTYRTGNITESFNADGRLISITNTQGELVTLSYLDDVIESVTDSNGNAISFYYDTLSVGRLSSITDPEGNRYIYSYNNLGSLISVTYPDDTQLDYADNPKRIYHYEDSNFPKALTGITDENGNRYATWSYDEEGRAISSEHANGVDKTTLTYNADGTTTVTNPLGKQTTYHFTTIQGVRKVTQVEGHPTASCEGANKSYSYDVNGNVISKTDWNGVTTTYTYDMDRNLELSRTEAEGTPQERTITTEWHPQFRLPTKITEPNRITEYTYDAQGRQLSHRVGGI